MTTASPEPTPAQLGDDAAFDAWLRDGLARWGDEA